MKRLIGLIFITLLPVLFIGINSTAHATTLGHYDWTIDKYADINNVTLNIGEEYLVTYYLDINAYFVEDPGDEPLYEPLNGASIPDQFATLYDSNLGTIVLDAQTNVPTVLSYGSWIGRYATPGSYTVVNTAIITTDTGTEYQDDWVIQVEVAPVPEPATMLLIGTGLAGLAVTRLRRRKK